MVTASGRPSTRISSGSSTATSSSTPSRVIVTLLRGLTPLRRGLVAGERRSTSRLLAHGPHGDRRDLVFGTGGVDVRRGPDQEVGSHLGEVEGREHVAGLDPVGD